MITIFVVACIRSSLGAINDLCIRRPTTILRMRLIGKKEMVQCNK